MIELICVYFGGVIAFGLKVLRDEKYSLSGMSSRDWAALGAAFLWPVVPLKDLFGWVKEKVKG